MSLSLFARGNSFYWLGAIAEAKNKNKSAVDDCAAVFTDRKTSSAQPVQIVNFTIAQMGSAINRFWD